MTASLLTAEMGGCVSKECGEKMVHYTMLTDVIVGAPLAAVGLAALVVHAGPGTEEYEQNEKEKYDMWTPPE